MGLAVQVRDIRAFARSQKIRIDRVFRDKAKSGVIEHRKQLDALLRACERGEYDTIVIPSLDRLSRDVRIAENLFWQFRQLGIQVRIADMPHYDAENRREVLIRQIREAIAEDSRKEIIERLLKGRQERLRKGRLPGGVPPYGFVRRGRTIVIHEREAAAVRLIFRLATSSLGNPEIAAMLNRKGFVQRNGRSWTPRQIAATLSR